MRFKDFLRLLKKNRFFFNLPKICRLLFSSFPHFKISLFFANGMAAFLFAHAGYFEPWGNESDLKLPSPPSRKEEVSIATRIADAVIEFHQKVISPVDGPRSHYRPSSSQYMHQAMHNYGFLKGFLMGCDRLLRENDEEWVYRTIQIEGRLFKYDPPKIDKYDECP